MIEDVKISREKKRKKNQNNAIDYLSLIPLFLILRKFNFANGEIF